MCSLAGASIATTKRLLSDANHKTIENMKKSLDFERKRCVEREEKLITFGGSENWKDAEADEAVFAKTVNEKAKDKSEETSWEQWAGLVERGRPESLVLWKTDAS
jgi:hypothetical protein